MQKRLPGVCKIYKVERIALPQNMIRKFIAKIPIHVSAPIFIVDFVGFPTCNSSCKKDKSSSFQTTELVFDTNIDFNNVSDCAFIVVDANSNSWVIGNRENKNIEITSDNSFGSTTSKATTQIKISFTDKVSLLPIVF